MARMQDLPEGERKMLRTLELPQFAATPFVAGGQLSERRIAIGSTAALQRRDDRAFGQREYSYRVIPGDVEPGDLIMSHGSVNFDRTGFQKDLNVCFPLDRLHEFATAGTIGSVADYHYSLSGAVSPVRNEGSIRDIARNLKAEAVDTGPPVPV